jgi:O-antigen/teichoic acid export membrane protein
MALARNATFNLLGAAVPAVAALLTVPVLIAHLGSSAYGVLVLVTAIVGYFAILDVNATAGSVKFIAQHHAAGEHTRLRRVLSFGATLYLGIGAVGGAAIAFFSAALVQRVFNVPAELQAEAVLALRIGGLAFLAAQLQIYLQSVPQALQRYDLTGRLEAVFGTAASVITMGVAWAGFGLVGVVVARLLLSVVNIVLLLRIVRRLLPGGLWSRPDRATARDVAGFSAWAYLARLAALSAAHSDKLLIGAIVDMRALAWYSVPFLLVNRVYALAFRLAQVMFPRASALAAAGRHEQLRANYLDAVRYVAFVNAAILLLLVGLAPEVMRHWAGAEFGTLAVTVLVVLAAAVFTDALTNLPSLVNDGLGHPRISGTTAVLRAAAGLLAAWVAVREHGILGAALAQGCVSLAATTLFVFYVHGRTVPVGLLAWARQALAPVAPLLLLVVAAAFWSLQREPLSLPAAFGLLLGWLAVLAVYGWGVIVRPEHRVRLVAHLRGRLARGQRPAA